jgi:hypothetical protein
MSKDKNSDPQASSRSQLVGEIGRDIAVGKKSVRKYKGTVVELPPERKLRH